MVDLSVPLILTKEQTNNFWGKVAMSGVECGCWLWIGCCGPKGHGYFGINRSMVSAHRISYAIHVGPIPKGEGYHGTCVLHKCDVACCVNPSHLWLGTVDDNNKDRERKGRGGQLSGERSFSRMHPERLARGDRHGSKTHPEKLKRGEENGNSVLTVEQVRKIRELYASGLFLQKDLASSFGVSPPTIRFILTGETWRHVS